MNIMTPKDGDVIAVWFSCGVASACAGKLTEEKYPYCDIRHLYNPVIEEHPDNLRFLRDYESWIGKTVEFVINSKYPECSADAVWRKRKYMAGHAGAPCTVHLKKEARQEYENNNHIDWHVLGFTLEEKKRRYEPFIMGERPNTLPILIEKNMTKAKCFEMLNKSGLKRSAIYEMGFPNGNCIGCVKGQYGKYWNTVRKHYPDIFESRCKLSRELNVKLWKLTDTDRRFLDELPEDFDDGQQVMDFECGIFCEEKF